MESPTFREAVTNAVRFWERMRLVYNGVLVIIVIAIFGLNYPPSWQALSNQKSTALFVFFILAIVANVLYSVAYVPDVILQLSGYRETWLRYRWVLFVVGVLTSGILAQFWASGIFEGHN
ncbi:MAG TPA: hypothetical protein VGZ48_09495 [Candidatus Acidoferrales bacterium]|jgi:hypothetical protein|nr:hypothetical protein [Candidatus Acidoferrales bacterium]